MPLGRQMNAHTDKQDPLEIGVCNCDQIKSLFLLSMLSDNPIYCGECRQEADPNKLGFDKNEIDKMNSWHLVAGSLYKLWIDSGEYEEYAKACLTDPFGEINTDGIDLAKDLSNKIPTKFWMFSDTEDGTPTHCPICKNGLNLDVRWGTGCCEKCSIQI